VPECLLVDKAAQQTEGVAANMGAERRACGADFGIYEFGCPHSYMAASETGRIGKVADRPEAAIAFIAL